MTFTPKPMRISPLEQSASSRVDNDKQPTPDQNELPFLTLLITVARRKRLVAGTVTGAGLLGLILALVLPSYFTATTRIMPPQQTQSTTALLMSELATSGLGSLASLAGKDVALKNPNDLYIGMLRSDSVEIAIVNRFDLQRIYRQKHLSDAQKELENATSIISGKDNLIDISFDARDPKLAAEVANAYVEELRNLTKNLAVSEASQRRLFFQQQLQQAKNDLADAEVALKETEQKTGMIQLDSQAKATIEAIAGIRAQIAAREVQLGAMSSFATSQNPDYLLLQKEIAGLRAQLANLEQSKSGNNADPLVATGKIPAVGLEYVRRYRDVTYQEAIFEVMAKQFEAAKLDEAKEAIVIQVVDPARPPDKKSWPHRTFIVAIALFAGLLSGIIAALGADTLDRMRSNQAISEQIAQLKFYARVKDDIGASPRS